MNTRFVLPIDIEYPKSKLFEFQHSSNNYVSNIHYAGIKRDTAIQDKFFDYRVTECQLADDFCKQFNLDITTKESKFNKILAGGILPVHTDPLRTAVIMVPLTDSPAPIEYYVGKIKVFEYYYTGVTIINAKIPHGVPKIDTDRIFYQVDVFEDWEAIVNKYEKGTLLK